MTDHLHRMGTAAAALAHSPLVVFLTGLACLLLAAAAIGWVLGVTERQSYRHGGHVWATRPPCPRPEPRPAIPRGYTAGVGEDPTGPGFTGGRSMSLGPESDRG